MSISPKEKEIEMIKVSATKKAEYMIKKSVSFFWKNPLKYSFYIVALIGVIGNVIGKVWPLPFYILLSILGVVEIVKELYLFFHPEQNLLLNEKK